MDSFDFSTLLTTKTMRKKIYFSLILFLLFYSDSFSQMKRDVIATNKIKATTTYISENKNERGKKRSRKLYDKKGNNIEFIFYDKNEQLEKSKEVCEYNNNNDLVNRKELDTLGGVESEFIYIYLNNKLITEKEIQNDYGRKSFKTTTKYFYDKKGILIKEEYKKRDFNIKNGRKKSKVIYSNNQKGNPVEKININADGSIYNKWVNVYDENENVIKTTVYYPLTKYGGTLHGQFKLKDSWEYKYDKTNNKIEEINYDENGNLISRTIINYDENGNEIERIEFGVTGTIISRTTTTINNTGKEIKSETYNSGRGTYFASFEYEYYE